MIATGNHFFDKVKVRITLNPDGSLDSAPQWTTDDPHVASQCCAQATRNRDPRTGIVRLGVHPGDRDRGHAISRFYLKYLSSRTTKSRKSRSAVRSSTS